MFDTTEKRDRPLAFVFSIKKKKNPNLSIVNGCPNRKMEKRTFLIYQHLTHSHPESKIAKCLPNPSPQYFFP